MNALIIGGTSGLGFCVAQLLIGSYTVHITGRADPHAEGLVYHEFDIEPSGNHFANIEKLLDAVGQVDLLVYAAGYFQDGTITDITEFEIATMEAVGLTVPMLVVRSILMRQGALAGFIAITSTSEWTPRLREPVYTAVKAGLGMFARSISLDDRLKKVLVAGPAGMKTSFWQGTSKDVGTMLEPGWVAEQILHHFKTEYRYKYIRVLREPPRVEEMELRIL